MLYPRPKLAILLQKAPELAEAIWQALSSVTAEHLVSQGRTYGGGLHKLEPGELANMSADVVLRVLPKGIRLGSHQQLPLFVT